MMQARDYVEKLKLQAHPEGGWFAEHYRSTLNLEVAGFEGSRNAATSIYFLLEAGQFSALHRIKSDEIWHFYEGGALDIIEIDLKGNLITTRLGRNLRDGEQLSYTVKAGHWFGSRPSAGSEFSLVGCTVSPGFDFADFEMPDQSWFLQEFPRHEAIIREITRP
jgi:predicted cupin superfamily sugar epimerase